MQIVFYKVIIVASTFMKVEILTCWTYFPNVVQRTLWAQIHVPRQWLLNNNWWHNKARSVPCVICPFCKKCRILWIHSSLKILNENKYYYVLLQTYLVNSSRCFLKLSDPGFSGSWIILFLLSLFFFLFTLWAIWAAQFFGNNWNHTNNTFFLNIKIGFDTKFWQRWLKPICHKILHSSNWFVEVLLTEIAGLSVHTLSLSIHCSSHIAVITWLTSSDISLRNQCAYCTLVVPIECLCGFKTNAHFNYFNQFQNLWNWAPDIPLTKHWQLNLQEMYVSETSSHLFRTQFVCGLHKMCTDHGECYAVSVLSWKLHALFELMFKYWCIKAGEQKRKRKGLSIQYDFNILPSQLSTNAFHIY